MIIKERLKASLLDLVQIDSHSRQERAIALHLVGLMKELGASVTLDDAGDKTGGDVGNLIAHFDSTVSDAEPLLLSAHMDTVAPGEGVVPVVEGDVIRSDGRTVLGGDDKSGIAIILEVLRSVSEDAVPRGDIDVVFTICEEVGLLGAKLLDLTQLRATSGIVLDTDSIGFLVTKAPAVNYLEMDVYGLEAHAGICPERGISALEVAAKGIAAMRLGRIDEETTANLGIISGGTAVNIIPNHVHLRGEVRSHKNEKLERQTSAMLECLNEAATRYALEINGEIRKARVDADVRREYDRMDLPDDAPIVRRIGEAARELGLNVDIVAKGGGSDANVFNKRGLTIANLASGMRDIHTLQEWLDLNDLVSSARIVQEVVRLTGSRKIGQRE